MEETIVQDVKNVDGSWSKGFSENNILYRTVGYRIWKGIKARCNKPWKTKFKTYIEAENKFESFNRFMDWVTTQSGYNKGWHLDKDLLLKGNKAYSETTCVFLPQQINKFLSVKPKLKSILPNGVREFKGKFNARCCNADSVRIFLGVFTTPEEAFGAYKGFKESVAKALALKWKDELDARAYNALINYEVSEEN